jgi:hypothetical protein
MVPDSTGWLLLNFGTSRMRLEGSLRGFEIEKGYKDPERWCRAFEGFQAVLESTREFSD